MAKKSHAKGALAVGLGLAAAAVSSYLLYGKEGAKNRKKARGWMLKAKGEVLDKIEKAKKIDRETYYKAVDDVEKRYRKLKSVSNKELAELARELKGHWKEIERQSAKGGKKIKKAVKKAVPKKRSQKKRRK